MCIRDRSKHLLVFSVGRRDRTTMTPLRQLSNGSTVISLYDFISNRLLDLLLFCMCHTGCLLQCPRVAANKKLCTLSPPHSIFVPFRRSLSVFSTLYTEVLLNEKFHLVCAFLFLFHSQFLELIGSYPHLGFSFYLHSHSFLFINYNNKFFLFADNLLIIEHSECQSKVTLYKVMIRAVITSVSYTHLNGLIVNILKKEFL